MRWGSSGSGVTFRCRKGFFSNVPVVSQPKLRELTTRRTAVSPFCSRTIPDLPSKFVLSTKRAASATGACAPLPNAGEPASVKWMVGGSAAKSEVVQRSAIRMGERMAERYHGMRMKAEGRRQKAERRSSHFCLLPSAFCLHLVLVAFAAFAQTPLQL